MPDKLPIGYASRDAKGGFSRVAEHFCRSMRAARYAGSQPATTPTATKVAAALARVSQSRGSMPLQQRDLAILRQRGVHLVGQHGDDIRIFNMTPPRRLAWSTRNPKSDTT